MSTSVSNRMNIAFAINEKYADHAAVTMSSIAEHNTKSDISFYILSSDISMPVRERIKTLEQRYESISIIFIDVDRTRFNKLGLIIQYTSIETYYRFLLADLLIDVDKLLYLDADILVVGDISALWSKAIDELYCAGVEDKNIDVAHKKKLGIPESQPYINTGVLLLNLEKIRKNFLTEKLFTFASHNRNTPYQDQDAINVVLGGSAIVLPDTYNYMVWGDKDDIKRDDVKIVHLTGAGKPWDKNRKSGYYCDAYQIYRYRTYAALNRASTNFKFGLLTCYTDNIGDAVQSIAARRFLPRVDYYINRDAVDHTDLHPGEVVKTIINGWYGYQPENWPPEQSGFYPLAVSMFAERRIKDAFSSPASRAFLNSYNPVGARDKSTYKFFQSIDVDTYYSGCMTLTLKRDERITQKDYILAMDVSDDVFEEIKRRTNRPVYRLNVMKPDYTTSEQSIHIAELYLALYQAAHAVVTTRLHVMLPSLALETPVLFLNDITNHEPDRFDGLADLVHRVSVSNFMQNEKIYNFEKPPKNKTAYKKIRANLESLCEEFTGYNKTDGFLEVAKDDQYNDTEYILTFGRMVNDAHRSYLLENESRWRQQTVELRDNEINHLKGKILSLENSLSWRITSVLRSGSKTIKKIINK